MTWNGRSANVQPSMEEEDIENDVDEPPDRLASLRSSSFAASHSFQKTPISRPRDRAESLLTKALQSQSEDELADSSTAGDYPRRRRSITSNTSEFTSDTGFSTPPRTNSPSPRMVDMPTRTRASIKFAVPPTDLHDATPKPTTRNAPVEAPAQVQPRKRCISFACANPKPASQADKANGNATLGKPAVAAATAAAAAAASHGAAKAATGNATEPRRPCIKFACPVRPPVSFHKPQVATLKLEESRKFARRPSPAPEPRSPTFRKHNRGSSSGRSPRPISRTSAARQPSRSPFAVRSKKYLTAKPEDLDGESSRFHEFASDAPLEDDWIRHAKSAMGQKITIDDTLKKELAIRLLGKEAEEEAAQEDEEDEDNGAAENDDEDEDEDDEDQDDEDDEDEDEDDGDENDTVEGDDDYMFEDQFPGYNFEAVSDGYNTDSEVGFASSDDEDDGLVLWTVKWQGQTRRREAYRDVGHSTLHQDATPVFRRLSVDEQSDSSAFVVGQAIRQDKPKNRELTNSGRPATPELPDSTDFVCGTFDEDRPLEEAYLSHMAARKREKYQTIPQDIDPSFPTSDPEDESGEDEAVTYKNRQQKQHPHQGSADDHVWLHGELEGLDDETDHVDGRRKKEKSPRRCRSPPPPRARGRSPAPHRHLFERHSPSKRMKSPAPKLASASTAALSVLASPPATSPVDMELSEADSIAHQALAFRPGLTQTKSLPRPPAIFRHQQHHHAQGKGPRRHRANNNGAASTKPMHIRGALDIVKGLEQKRQRRKEKFQQKYCNRARKGQASDRRPQRGEGAERMRELGLLMAGKIGQGHYVLSI